MDNTGLWMDVSPDASLDHLEINEVDKHFEVIGVYTERNRVHLCPNTDCLAHARYEAKALSDSYGLTSRVRVHLAQPRRLRRPLRRRFHRAG